MKEKKKPNLLGKLVKWLPYIYNETKKGIVIEFLPSSQEYMVYFYHNSEILKVQDSHIEIIHITAEGE